MSSVKSKLLLTMPIMLIMTLSLIATLPPTIAQPWNTQAFIYWGPTPIGVGQAAVVEAWVSPRPRFNQDFYYNYVFTITKPNGAIETITVNQTEHPGTIWFNYIPDQTGTYTIKMTWAGYDAPSWAHPPPGFTSEWWRQNANDYYSENASAVDPWISGDHEPCESANIPMVVQQAQIPEWPAAPLPTDFWDYPINPENRDWFKITGPWPDDNFNETKNNWNPYTQPVKSPHVLWRLPPTSGLGGQIGGPYGTGDLYSSSRKNFNTIMAGTAYATWNNQIHAIDIRTGQELWAVSGSFDFGKLRSTPELIELGSTSFQKYNAFTGAKTLDRTYGGHNFDDQVFLDPYVIGFEIIGNVTYLVRWTTEGTTSNFASRVGWNKTFFNFNTGEGVNVTEYEFGRQGGPNVVTVGDVNTMCYITYPIYGECSGWDVATGTLLWHRFIEDFESRNSIGGLNGYFFMTEWPDHWNKYNMRTGQLVWTGEGATYPWGDFWAYQVCVDLDRMYGINYDGHLYAYNLGTGKFDWKYYVGSTSPYDLETPYNKTWPIYSGPVSGGGVIIAATSEWGTPNPIYRGQRMFAVDTATGNGLWQLMGMWSPNAIVEGYLLASNMYDGYSYCFGRGPTQTTIDVSEPIIAAGDHVWVTGRITDTSPGPLNGHPAISRDSMQPYLEWLLWQQEQPHDTKGVPVTVYAAYPNGTILTVGSTMSDGQGYYRIKWTPPAHEENFILTAYFNGDDSYYSSWSLTQLTVDSATPAAPEYPQPIAPIDYTTTSYGIMAAVVILIIVGAANLLIAFRKK